MSSSMTEPLTHMSRGDDDNYTYDDQLVTVEVDDDHPYSDDQDEFVSKTAASKVPIPDDDPQTAAAIAYERSISRTGGSGDGGGGGRDDTFTRVVFSWRKMWSFTGPGWLMSIAYLDPGNLISDVQAGVVGGYSLIWVLWWATVMGYFFQILSARLGVVTGHDLAQICRHEYSRPLRIIIWLMTEIAIIGSDIQEVVGSGIALHILFGIPTWVGVLITAFDTFTFMFLHYFGVRKLEALFAVLISTMAVCFCIQFVIGKPDGAAILKGWVVPIVHDNSLIQAVGMLGAVIMPHNMFLHSSLVLSRDVNRQSTYRVREANYYFALEAAVSLLVSFFINLAVVAVFAAGFQPGSDHCVVQENDCENIGLENADEKLHQAFGAAARYVWAIGLLAAGQSSTMTGTFAGQYVMQGFLNLHIAPWVRTMLTRSIALVPAMVVALVANKKMDTLDEYLNVLQSIQLPFALLPVVIFNSNRKIMGVFTLSKKAQMVYWTMCLLVIATNVYLIINFAQTTLPHTPLVYALLGIFSIAYASLIVYLAFHTAHDVVLPDPSVNLKTVAPISYKTFHDEDDDDDDNGRQEFSS